MFLNVMLISSVWSSRYPTESGREEFFFINTELSCMILVSHIESKRRGWTAVPIPVWYHPIDSDEVVTTICDRDNRRRWIKSVYRIYDDFFQWVNLLEEETYSFVYTREEFECIPVEVSRVYERGLNKILSIPKPSYP